MTNSLVIVLRSCANLGVSGNVCLTGDTAGVCLKGVPGWLAFITSNSDKREEDRVVMMGAGVLCVDVACFVFTNFPDASLSFVLHCLSSV